MNDFEGVPAFLLGVAFTFFMTVLGYTVIVDSDATAYYKTVCSYEQGTYHGDICIDKSGKVINLGKYPTGAK